MGNWNCYGNFIKNSGAIVFSSDMNRRTGCDFYISFRINRFEWQNPVRLDEISTGLDEYSIFVHPDGETIYFSSNGFKGLGGFDIFGCKIKFDYGFYFHNFKNLYQYNSYRNEAFPILVSNNGNVGYYNYSSGGRTKILRIKNLPVKPVSTCYLYGKVYDKHTNKPVENAYIQLKPQNKILKTIINKKTYSDGFFGVSLHKGVAHRIMIIADDYLLYNDLRTFLFTG